ncbi:MAG: pyruvoyl-dependent arginine decarboxylase [Candidatus Thermoplasmatota archaeon]
MMMFEKATRFTVKTGKATSSQSTLNAVDKAMRKASMGDLNLIEVSSILPKGIKKVNNKSTRRGDFRPAVLSKATGSGKKLAAGLAWGFRDDDSGGYVIEHFAEKEELDINAFKEELRDRLREMGEVRGTELKEIDLVYEELDVDEGEFGCVISGLVYLP